jgi:hypothetical protein
MYYKKFIHKEIIKKPTEILFYFQKYVELRRQN